MKFSRLLAIVATVVALGAALPAPANAGTLTAASFTTNGSGYSNTNASNTRYDWRATTATSGTVSRVEATLPTGTKATGTRYLPLSTTAGSGNYARTPNTAAMNPTGDIDIRVRASMPDWYASCDNYYGGKFTGNGNQSYALFGSGNGVGFYWYDGTNQSWVGSPIALPYLAPNSYKWLRATFTPNNGASTRVINYYISDDGANWTSVGSRTGSATTVASSPGDFEVGTIQSGTYGICNKKMAYMSVANTISGTTSSPSNCTATGVVVCFDPSDYTSGTTFTSSSAQHETWGITRTGSNLPADISTDIPIAESSGLPAGGIATYRAIDNKAIYQFPTATSLTAGTPMFLALSGFTNTATAGSYASTISTRDTGGNIVDSVTTSVLSFSDLATVASVGVAVDPSLTFTIGDQSVACLGVAPTAGTGAGPAKVSFGHLATGTAIRGQYLQVSTNASSGWSTYIRATGPLTSGSHVIPAVTGTQAAPSTFSGEGFGYFSSFGSQFTGPNWAGLSTSNVQLWSYGVPLNMQTMCMMYRVDATPVTPAGTYATTVIYTTVPKF